jgi:hypothetical protein
MRRPIAALVALLLATAPAGCGGGKASSASSARESATPTHKVTVAPADRPACARLFTRLQRVTAALQTSSELIAHSVNKRQLSHRIAIQQVQLERSARLMSEGPIPTPLVATDQQLVKALRAFSRDFARAKAPASRGDFQAAVGAMTDPPVVNRILRASKTIEDACK